MSEAELGSWTVPEIPIGIEYSLLVVEEIRRLVTEGVQKLSRGGIEVGGVLYGVHDGDSVRLLAARPIACEHARGPSLILSEADRAALASQLKAQAQDPGLEGLTCAGWFLSHTRNGIELTESDLEIYDSFFHEPWQVTLVVRPGRGNNMRAGFFVREFDGAIQSARSYLEFSFPDRLATVPDRPRRAARPTREPQELPPALRQDLRHELPREEPSRTPAPVMPEYLSADPEALDPETLDPETLDPEDEFEAPNFTAAAPARKKWVWLAAWAVMMVAGAAGGVWYFQPEPRPEPLQLLVVEKDGVLQIRWNSSAKPVKAATGGMLEIVDGTESHRNVLSTSDLALGTFTYRRTTGDAKVRLTAQEADGTSVLEASQFLGPAVTQTEAKSDAQATNLDVKPASSPASNPSNPAVNPGAKVDAKIDAKADAKPAPKPDTAALEQSRSDAATEVQRLHQENAAQNARIQQLERTVRILQTRLGNK